MENNESQKQEYLPKKAYHSPKLRACGSVKEQTRTGTGGTLVDTQWITATVALS